MKIGVYIVDGSSHFAVLYENKIYSTCGVVDYTENRQFVPMADSEITDELVHRSMKLIASYHPIFGPTFDRIDTLEDKINVLTKELNDKVNKLNLMHLATEGVNPFMPSREEDNPFYPLRKT